MLITSQFYKQTQVITSPLEMIDSAQDLENASEKLEVLNAPMNQQNETVYEVHLQAYLHCKHQNSQSLFHE